MNRLQFPCPTKEHKYTTIDDCSSCQDRMTCDIYATMIAETADAQKE